MFVTVDAEAPALGGRPSRQASLVFRPSLRQGNAVGLILYMELLGLAIIWVAVGGRAWERPRDLVSWLASVAYFSGGPILYLIFGRLFADGERVGKRDALGRVKAVPRSKVRRMERVTQSRTYFIGEDDELLLFVRPGTWSDRQLGQLADYLGVPFQPKRRRGAAREYFRRQRERKHARE